MNDQYILDFKKTLDADTVALVEQGDQDTIQSIQPKLQNYVGARESGLYAPEFTFGDAGQISFKSDPNKFLESLSERDRKKVASDPQYLNDVRNRHNELLTRIVGGENPLDDDELFDFAERTGMRDIALSDAVSAGVDFASSALVGAGNVAIDLGGRKFDPKKIALLLEGAAFGTAETALMGMNILDAGVSKIRKLFSGDEADEILDQKRLTNRRMTYKVLEKLQQKREERAQLYQETFNMAPTEIETISAAGELFLDPTDEIIAPFSVVKAGSKAIRKAQSKFIKTPMLGLEDDLLKKSATLKIERDVTADSLALVEKRIAENKKSGNAKTVSRYEAKKVELEKELTKSADDLATTEKALVDIRANNEIALKQLNRSYNLVDMAKRGEAKTAQVLGKVAQSTASGIEKVQQLTKGPVGQAVAVGAGAGLATGDVLTGGLTSVASAYALSPKRIRDFGKKLENLGTVRLQGEMTNPFWRRYRGMNASSGIKGKGFTAPDSLLAFGEMLQEVSELSLDQAAKGAAGGFLVGWALGEGDVMQGITQGVISGQLGAAMGPFRAFSADYKDKRAFDRLVNERDYVREQFKVAKPDSYQAFNRLSTSQQLGVAHYLHVNPDVDLQVVDRDGFSGFHVVQDGRSKIVINRRSKDPLAPVIAHELMHDLQARGHKDAIVSRLVGIQQGDYVEPGYFTRVNPDGNLELNEEGKELKAQYEDLMSAGGLPVNLTMEQFALEVAAEQGADFLLNGGFEKALRTPKLISGMQDYVQSKETLTRVLGALGVTFDFQSGQPIKGTGIFENLKSDQSINKLVRNYLVDPGQVTETQDNSTNVTPDVWRADPSKLALFDNSFEVRRDSNGNISGVRDGKLQDDALLFRTPREINQLLGQIGDALVGTIESESSPANAVKLRTQEDGKQVYAGQYLSDSAITAVENTGVLNERQLAYLKSINDTMKSGSGSPLLFFYQSATRGGKRNRSLAGQWKQEIPYAWLISRPKNGVGFNLSFRTVAPQKLVDNLNAKWKKRNDISHEIWTKSEDMIADAWKLLDNYSSGRPGDEGIGSRKRDYLNAAMGFAAKTRADVNPLYSEVYDKKDSSVIVTRRLDRTNRMSKVDGKPLPWSYQSYRQAYQNFRPEIAGIRQFWKDLAGTETELASREDATTSSEMRGDGRKFEQFFSDVTEGVRQMPHLDSTPYTPVIKMNPDVVAFQDVRYKHRGNFDNHIATSIPGFDEIQAVVGNAIAKTFPRGSILDVGASEGALVKALAETANIKGVALDPNPSMAKTFSKTQVPGAEYSMTAFGTKEEAGKSAWTEEDGTEIKFYDPKGKKFDVVHEAMVFQFISNARGAQIKRMKELLKKDGVVVLEEKVGNVNSLWEASEAKKDQYKSKYYSQEELAAKKAEVLQTGADSVEGMTDLQVSAWELEEALAQNFNHVVQIWDSGNFKGYVAGDNIDSVNNFVSNTQDTNTEYSTVQTPRAVSGDVMFRPQTETPEFKKWFGDSKVVDEEGKPLVVYHGGLDMSFSEFNTSGSSGKTAGTGAFFTDSYRLAKTYSNHEGTVAPPPSEQEFLENPKDFGYDVWYDDVYEVWKVENGEGSEWESEHKEDALVDAYYELTQGTRPGIYDTYLRMEDPMVVDAKGQNWDSISEGWDLIDEEGENYDTVYEEEEAIKAVEAGNATEYTRSFGMSTDEWAREARATGHDGLIIKNVTDEGPEGRGYVGESTIYVVFNPNQIKSATDNVGTFDPNNPDIRYRPAFHGSPHTFDKFTTERIGTGEGAQAYGWGMYFAGDEQVAKYYQDGLSRGTLPTKYDGKELTREEAKAVNRMQRLGGDKKKALASIDEVMASLDTDRPLTTQSKESLQIERDFTESLEDFNWLRVQQGRLYEVELKPAEDEYLVWDKPLSEQSELVVSALEKLSDSLTEQESAINYTIKKGLQLGEFTGGDLVSFLGKSKEASMRLKELGIRGIKYLDGSSRGAGEGNYNYVIFDDADVEVTRRYSPEVLRHYSRMKGMVETDPEKHGTGLKGAERARKRDYPELYLNRTYFGRKGYRKEDGLGANTYEALVEMGDIYDFAEDPDNLRQSANEEIMSSDKYAPMDFNAKVTLYERKIHETGYRGYYVGDVVAMFDKQPVREVSFRPAIESDFTKDNILDLLKRSDWAILTPENPNKQKLSEQENAELYSTYKKSLDDADIKYVEVKGMYGYPENSFAILKPDLKYEDYVNLARDLGQESVLAPFGLVYPDGSVEPSTSVSINPNASDYFTTLPDGTKFEVALSSKQAPGSPFVQNLTNGQLFRPITLPDVNPGKTIGTRKGGVNDPMGLNTGFSDEFKSYEKNKNMPYKQNSVAMLKYPEHRHVTTKSPSRASEYLINQYTDNLLYIYDSIPENVRNRSKLWYEGANIIANRKSSEHDITVEQASAILAVLSPQTEWFVNVERGRRVPEIVAEGYSRVFDEEFVNKAMQIFIEDPKKSRKSKIKNSKVIERIAGKTLSEIPLYEDRGMYVRIFDELFGSKEYPAVSPEGDILDTMRSAKGAPIKFSWGSNAEIGKAIQAYENSSIEVLHEVVGNGNKVRSFFNNIVNPGDPGSVTIDTHAVAAATLIPVASDDIRVLHNFGSNPKGSKIKISNAGGFGGAYPLYHEAHVRAANARGVLPREMQSITWEAVRTLFENKNKKDIPKVVSIWERAGKGEITNDQAREEIVKLFGGFKTPGWANE